MQPSGTKVNHKPFLVLYYFDFNWWGERPREPNNQVDSGSRGRSPHQIDTISHSLNPLTARNPSADSKTILTGARLWFFLFPFPN
jgi:hypothetical protein